MSTAIKDAKVLKLDRVHRTTSVFKRSCIGLLAGLTIAAATLASSVHADPADDALAKLNELSRQAEQTTEATHTAQIDLDNKLAEQAAAEQKHNDDLAALTASQAKLSEYQTIVDKFAVAMYMGGNTDGMNAILTAASPQGLIDQLSAQHVMAAEMSSKMDTFREVSAQAATLERESAQSADTARTAAEQAATVRAELQAKQSELQVQIALVRQQYLALTPQQQEVLAAPVPVPLPEGIPVPDALPPLPGEPPAPEGIPPGDILAQPSIPAPGSSAGNIAVQAALTRVGSPYSWGAAGPSSFDCSGLVMWAFQQAGVSLPHSSQALAQGGQDVSIDALQPGDLITYYSDASHVAIYVGDGMIVHASTYGTPVRVVPLTSSGPIYNARRY